MRPLRDYQQSAVYGGDSQPGILPSLEKHASTVCVMATGLGKTRVLAEVVANWKRGNVLCLAHRIELLDQMADTLATELGYRPVVEQGIRGMDDESLFAAGHVVVGSIQSMITPRRRRKFGKHPFGLIVIDECHRSTSASYVKLVDDYRELDPSMKLLGVTATPNRTDGTALGLVFESVAFDMGITAGIDAGWLVDVHQKFAMVEDLDLSKIKTRRNQLGEVDFDQNELSELLTEEGPLHAMSRPVLDSTVNGQQAIIFTASVAHAHQWAAVLNHYRPGCAAAVDGTMGKGEGGERTEIIASFKRGELQFLLNFNLTTEGFDAPATAIIVMGRPTKSKLVYMQMLGRCTRTLPGVVDGIETPDGRKDAIAASPKPWATVLDFVGANRCRAITATDILGGNYDVDLRAVANEIMGARSGNVRDAIAKARAAMFLEREERTRARKVVESVEVSYILEDVDKFSGQRSSTLVATDRGTVTDAQIAALVNLGVEKKTASLYSRKQASAIMDSLRQKRCTLPQAKQLRRFGFNPANFNVEQASEQLEQIAQRGWKWP